MENVKSLFKIGNVSSLFIISIPRMRRPRLTSALMSALLGEILSTVSYLYYLLSGVLERTGALDRSLPTRAGTRGFQDTLPCTAAPEVKAGTGVILLLLHEVPRWGSTKYRTSQKRGLGEKWASTVGELWKGWWTTVTTKLYFLLIVTLKLFIAS